MKQTITLGQLSSVSYSLEEAMTYGQLFKMSDPLRIWRSGTVRGPPLEIHGKNNTAVHTFNFKSYPSTTGLRHRGYIKFQRPTNGKPMPAENMPVEVDCECPDYKYRWAWANRQKGAGRIGPQSLNQAINRAPRITNPSGKPALCKHLLAARNYIYGLIQKFPKKGEPAYNEKETEQDVDWKLDQLVKHAQKRWSEYPAQQQTALKRQKLHRAQQQVLNVRGPGRNADQPQGIDMNAPVPLPPETPAPAASKKKTPTPPPIPTVKPGKQAQPGPKQPVKNQQPQAPKARGNKNKNQQESLVVITANSSNHMNTDALLKKTKALVEELEGEMQDLAQEAPPSEPGAEVPPADIAGGDPMGGGPESPEDEALELLRNISAGIDRMANELAPVEAEAEEEVGDELPGEAEDEEDGEEAAVPPVEDDDEFNETMPVATGA